MLLNTNCCIHLISNSIGGPKGPFCRVVAFSTTPFLQLLWSQLTDFLSSPSYIIVQSPTQSLEWHVWSSSSGDNCHAVHRSLSSGASVYECTMGFLPCPIFSVKPAYAISSHNCHRNMSLPSDASLWNGMFCRVEGQYETQPNNQNTNSLIWRNLSKIYNSLIVTWIVFSWIRTYSSWFRTTLNVWTLRRFKYHRLNKHSKRASLLIGTREYTDCITVER